MHDAFEGTALIPKISGSISILCSLYILNEVRIDYRSGRLPITPVTRAVLGMSVMVIVLGLAWGSSTWMVPPQPDDELLSYSKLAPSGNDWTCRLQGFFIQFAIGPPLYNAAILYIAQRSIFQNETVFPLNLEIAIHVGIMIWCACSATLFLLKDKYHSIGPICWASDAPDCADDNSCNVRMYTLVLYCIPLWIALAYTIASCVRIRRYVQQYHSNRKTVTQHADTLVALYSLAIFITYTPCIIWSFMFWNGASPKSLLWLFVSLEPLQGIWNLAIFLMNRRQDTRARLRKVFTSICCRLLCCNKRIASGGNGNDDDTMSSSDQNQQPVCPIANDGLPAISLESQA